MLHLAIAADIVISDLTNIKYEQNFITCSVLTELNFSTSLLTGASPSKSDKEIKQITDGGTHDELSAITQRVTQILDELRAQANNGTHTREYAEAREVMKICAGCGGITHEKE